MATQAARQDVVSGGFLSISRAAEYLGVSREKVNMLVAEGRLPVAVFGPKARCIPRQALEQFARKRLRQTAT